MSYNQKIGANFLGLAFHVASDSFIQMSFAQILTIPLARPIFIREINNRMYSTSAYYLANCSAAMLTFFLYPMTTTLASYSQYGLDTTGFKAHMDWMFVLVLTAFTGNFWGFMLGTFMESEVTAI